MMNNTIRKIWLSSGSADEEFNDYVHALIYHEGYRIIINGENSTRHDVYYVRRGNHRLKVSNQLWYSYTIVIEGSFGCGATTATIYKRNFESEMTRTGSFGGYSKISDIMGPRTIVATMVLDQHQPEINILVDGRETRRLCDECTAYMYDYSAISFREWLNE